MTVFFTSDLHLWHRSVAHIRRYGTWPQDKAAVTAEDVTWHNNLLAQRWDATVREDDIVWVLGDLIGSNKALPSALEWIYTRPGKKHIILGNHDPAHPMHIESHKFEDAYRTAFATVATMRKRRIAGQTVLLSHFPYEGDGDSKAEDRDVQYRLRNDGLTVLHGHTHRKERVTWAGSARQVHVGLDAWDYTPVSLDQVAGILQE